MNLNLIILGIKRTHILLFAVFVFMLIGLNGCSSSSGTEETSDSQEDYESDKTKTGSKISKESENSVIIYNAETEQQKEMYSSEKDTSYLYWLDDQLLITYGSTKCNIFALNVLFKSGYKTPDVNTLCADLYDTTFATDILPVVGINEIDMARPGDLIIWSYHVIIFESLKDFNGDLYVVGWWAGTNNPDNGDNIINNVCHGKYPLYEEFVVRRPVKK